MTTDPASPLAAALRAALRANEIGAASPYRLSFAGLGNSGASFGVFQNDCHESLAARQVLRQAMVNAKVARADAITAALSEACPHNPLSEADTEAANAALAADTGRPLVDALDEETFALVLRRLDMSINAAAAADREIDAAALCAIACWINMSGAPTTINRWLAGNAVSFDGRSVAPPAGRSATQADVLRYLAATPFYAENPRNLDHLAASIEAGVPLAA